VSAQILNGTSAQLGYTVPLMLVHAGKYKDRRQKYTHKLNITQKKQTKQNTAKQNYHDLVAFMTLRQETRWAYSTTLLHPHGAFSKHETEK